MGFKKSKSSSSTSSMSVQSAPKQRRKMFTSRLSKRPELIVVDEGMGCSLSCKSLCVGSFSPSGVFSIKPSSYGRSLSPHSTSTEILDSFSVDDDASTSSVSPVAVATSRVFIRTADLPHMKVSVARVMNSTLSDLDADKLVEHLHKPSSTPPLSSIALDENESWVALDDGNGNGMAPLAEAAIEALVKSGLDASINRGMWTANASTEKIIKAGLWDSTIFFPYNEGRPVPLPRACGPKDEKDVLLWTGQWDHKYYGHDIPAVRCEAIVNMSPRALVDLLVDSNRVKEYNKMSIGRDDILHFCKEETRVTKIIVGRSKPPMLGKTLVLKSLLHMEELPGGGERSGYVIVSRAISLVDDVNAPVDPKVLYSEMLMGMNIIRAVEGDPGRCVLINLNHLRSPMIPVMLARRLALGAAVNFINDIRALC
ncbi:hypothetical protein ACHAXA_007909 [Cyclostephanos tholiformis]|jgi:hypothetical protein|uniref:START domain-containing protein n=1 Tax=Cyclostephanos tholiformis TaxID=382380 RepID=A0ABD3SHV0_9STRA